MATTRLGLLGPAAAYAGFLAKETQAIVVVSAAFTVTVTREVTFDALTLTRQSRLSE